MALFGGFNRTSSHEIDVLRHDVAIFKNLIVERQHPLDLVRELLSNAGAKQVGATRIEISYTRDREGHIFDVSDNGCGMDFSSDDGGVGRLARFLGLGLSSIVGEKSDEFSWKGLGSKLAYQSRKVMIETRAAGQSLYEVRINEPWDSLNNNELPRPRITEHKDTDAPTGTRIRVVGHPPHRQEKPFTMDELRRFLLHRTFAGFTKPRENPPAVVLSVMGQVERLEFGLPEFKDIVFPERLSLDADSKTLFVNMALIRPPSMSVRLRGVLTWEPDRFGLSDENLNTGLLVSSRGIPYFELPLDECGARKIVRSNPGRARVCLVAECAQVYSEMNLSRSGLVDSAVTLEFREMLGQLLRNLEASAEYDEFCRLKRESRRAAHAADIVRDRTTIKSEDQKWVVLDRNGGGPMVLMREPKNDAEVIAILGKLESLGALPFAKFQTLAHPEVASGPDLFVKFQEEAAAEPTHMAMFGAEKRFRAQRRRDGLASQSQNVICWDLGGRGRKSTLKETEKGYKFLVDAGGSQMPVYVMKLMDGLRVMSTRELRERGIEM